MSDRERDDSDQETLSVALKYGSCSDLSSLSGDESRAMKTSGMQESDTLNRFGVKSVARNSSDWVNARASFDDSSVIFHRIPNRQVSSPLMFQNYKFENPLSTFDDDMEGTARTTTKPIVSVSKIRALKPLNTSKELASPGFVVFLNQCHSSAFKTGARRHSKTALLSEHSNDRFVRTGMKAGVGKYDTNSIEAHISSANVHLNRLNRTNMTSVIENLKMTNLPHDTIAELLLERASSSTSNPEKNVQLKTFAELGAEIARSESVFRQSLRTTTLAKFESIISDPDMTLEAKQNIATWVGHVFVHWILSRREFFSCMERICRMEDKTQAVEILRAAFWVAGEEIDKRKYYESATFYLFMRTSCRPSRYTTFLVKDLTERRDGEWAGPAVFVPRVKKSEDVEDLVDLEEQLKESFHVWYNSENAMKNDDIDCSFAVLAKVTFRVMRKMSKFSFDYANWVAALWVSKNPTACDVRKCVEKELVEYTKRVIEDFNANMWYIAFQFLAALYGHGFLSLEYIFEKAVNGYPDDCPKPKLATILEKMGEICYFKEEDLVRILKKKEFESPHIKAILIELAESGEVATELREAMAIRDLLFSVSENTQLDPSEYVSLKSFRDSQNTLYTALCARILTPEQEEQVNCL